MTVLSDRYGLWQRASSFSIRTGTGLEQIHCWSQQMAHAKRLDGFCSMARSKHCCFLSTHLAHKFDHRRRYRNWEYVHYRWTVWIPRRSTCPIGTTGMNTVWFATDHQHEHIVPWNWWFHKMPIFQGPDLREVGEECWIFLRQPIFSFLRAFEEDQQFRREILPVQRIGWCGVWSTKPIYWSIADLMFDLNRSGSNSPTEKQSTTN